MTSLWLIPWAQTEWSESGRLAARTPLPLTEAGGAQAQAWGEALAGFELYGVYASEEQTAQETAAAVAEAAGAKLRGLDGIEEVSFGLWEGLTEDTLKTRFPKAYKRWKDDPTSVCPPEGEEVTAAAERVRLALRGVRRKLEKANIAVVLGPSVCALLCCELSGEPLSEMRRFLNQGPQEFTDLERVLQAMTPTSAE